MTDRYLIWPMDCRVAMSLCMEPDSVDAICTDPPYGLSKEPDVAEVLRHWLAGDDYTHDGAGFMGRTWDSFVPGPAVWREAYRVLKPGGHLIAFFGTRTYHLGVMALRLAGFEIRDQIMWIYGSGFPKSLDVSKAIDKAAGVAFTASPAAGVGFMGPDGPGGYNVTKNQLTRSGDSTPEAREWSGWGTALKPAHEPIVLARKPLSEKTVAANVLRWGTGALNIDASRVAADRQTGWSGGGSKLYEGGLSREGGEARPVTGRFPANVMHDGSDEVLAEFPQAPGQIAKASTADTPRNNQHIYGDMTRGSNGSEPRDDAGSAARFFYCAKASWFDRNEGCETLPQRSGGMLSETSGQVLTRRDEGYEPKPSGNNHPTVKPPALMRYLCRLVTPPGGLVLDPFTGSGSTGKAAILEGFQFVGCEMTGEYLPIIDARLTDASNRYSNES